MTQAKEQDFQTRKADRFNELAGFEVESKLNIVGSHSIDDVAQILFEALNFPNRQFVIAPSLPFIKLSQTLVRHYGYYDKVGKLKKAFAVTQRASDGLLQVKRKGPKTLYHKNILNKSEQLIPLPWSEWTDEVEAQVIAGEMALLDNQLKSEMIFLIATARRTKLKVRIINRQNNRAYTIGVDETLASNNQTMRQIEIEYIGVEPDVLQAENPVLVETPVDVVTEIAEEIKALKKRVKKICVSAGIKVKSTQKTKFKWLVEMYHLDMANLQKYNQHQAR